MNEILDAEQATKILMEVDWMRDRRITCPDAGRLEDYYRNDGKTLRVVRDSSNFDPLFCEFEESRVTSEEIQQKEFDSLLDFAFLREIDPKKVLDIFSGRPADYAFNGWFYLEGIWISNGLRTHILFSPGEKSKPFEAYIERDFIVSDIVCRKPSFGKMSVIAEARGSNNICLSWSCRIGFGEMYLAWDDEKGRWTADTECIGDMDFVASVMSAWGSNILIEK